MRVAAEVGSLICVFVCTNLARDLLQDIFIPAQSQSRQHALSSDIWLLMKQSIPFNIHCYFSSIFVLSLPKHLLWSRSARIRLTLSCVGDWRESSAPLSHWKHRNSLALVFVKLEAWHHKHQVWLAWLTLGFPGQWLPTPLLTKNRCERHLLHVNSFLSVRQPCCSRCEECLWDIGPTVSSSLTLYAECWDNVMDTLGGYDGKRAQRLV